MTLPVFQEDLTSVLQHYTPSSILKSDALLACFRQFFAKGTPFECCELLLKHFKPQDILASIQSLLPPGFQIITSTQPHKYRKPAIEAQFSEPLISNKKKLAIVNRVFTISIATPIEDYGKLAVSQRPTSNDAITQIRELYTKIRSEPEGATATNRMCLLHFGNVVEKYAASISQSLRHRKTLSTAFDHIANTHQIDRKGVARAYTTASKYLGLAKHGGPSFLCWIQGSKSDIAALCEQDIKLLREYVSANLPDINAQLEVIDFSVAYRFISDLRVQGWDDDEIRKGRTGLTKFLRGYLDNNIKTVESRKPEALARGPLVDQRTEVHHTFVAESETMSTGQLTETTNTPSRKNQESLPKHWANTASGSNNVDTRQLTPISNVQLHDGEYKRQTSISSFQIKVAPRTVHPFERPTPDRQSLVGQVEQNSDKVFPIGYHINSLDTSASKLFHDITIYLENSCQNMILDEQGTLLTLDGAKLLNDLCNDFDSYCFTATIFKEKGLYVELRQVLSKAFILVEQVLLKEHPRTLACFFEVFTHLIQTGSPELALYLRQYIKAISAKLFEKGHPWGQICRLLGELHLESLEHVMARAWECITDVFDRKLGCRSPFAVSVRLDYIKRVYGAIDCLEEERLLHELLANLGDTPKISTPRVMLNLAHNLNRQKRHSEAREMAMDVYRLLEEQEMYAERIVERIESLKIISHSHFNQGMTLEAEQTMWMAINMIRYQWGIQHPWVSEFMNVLEGWLRCWGREQDAHALLEEVKRLVGDGGIGE